MAIQDRLIKTRTHYLGSAFLHIKHLSQSLWLPFFFIGHLCFCNSSVLMAPIISGIFCSPLSSLSEESMFLMVPSFNLSSLPQHRCTTMSHRPPCRKSCTSEDVIHQRATCMSDVGGSNINLDKVAKESLHKLLTVCHSAPPVVTFA